MELNDNQRTILDAMVKKVETTGICPTLGQLVRLTGIGRNIISGQLRGLMGAGYVSQEIDHGAPYRPLKTSDGLRIVIEARREHP